MADPIMRHVASGVVADEAGLFYFGPRAIRAAFERLGASGQVTPELLIGELLTSACDAETVPDERLHLLLAERGKASVKPPEKSLLRRAA
jgi:hypothetical protein